MRLAAKALAWGAWREQFNQLWRFSRVRTGLWLVAAATGTVSLFLWRLQPAGGHVPLQIPALTATLGALFVAFVLGLFMGRGQLYGRSVLRALHISPSPGAAVLLGVALSTLPGLAAGSLSLALLVGLHLSPGALWWSVPLLWALSFTGGVVGYVAALLSLVGWVFFHPRTLAILWALSLGAALGLANLLIVWLVLGGPMLAIADLVHQQAPWLLGSVAALTALPWLLLRLWQPTQLGGVDNWYREAYLRLQQLTDGRRGFRSSRWPRLLRGPAGALQARLWRELWLNWFTWVRVTGMLFILGVVIHRRESFILADHHHFDLLILGFGLTAAVAAFLELIGAAGGSDGPNIGLVMVAGGRAAQVVWAKWVTFAPIAALSAICTLIVSATLKAPELSLSLAAGCLGLGFSVIAMGGGLYDLDPHMEVEEREVPDLLRAILEQAPRRLGGLIGTGLAVVGTLGAFYLCYRLPGTALPVAAGFAALAHLALAPGYQYLRRLGM